MAPHTAALEDALRTLQQTGATLRVVLGTSALRGEGPVRIERFAPEDVRDLVYFGAAQPRHLLQQLIGLHAVAPVEPAHGIPLPGPTDFLCLAKER